VLTITFNCPTHPKYAATIRPGNGCKLCRLLFDVRNNAQRILSVPRIERTDADELILLRVE